MMDMGTPLDRSPMQIKVFLPKMTVLFVFSTVDEQMFVFHQSSDVIGCRCNTGLTSWRHSSATPAGQAIFFVEIWLLVHLGACTGYQEPSRLSVGVLVDPRWALFCGIRWEKRGICLLKADLWHANNRLLIRQISALFLQGRQHLTKVIFTVMAVRGNRLIPRRSRDRPADATALEAEKVWSHITEIDVWYSENVHVNHRLINSDKVKSEIASCQFD